MDRPMTLSRSVLAFGLCALVALAGCGRKPAELQTPSQAANDSKRSGGVGINQPAEPAPAPQQDRPFILDSLI
jgi:predicted small lipoprotein YifL